MLDFSKDHKFKLHAENVNDFSLKIQIKRSAPPLQKSKLNQKRLLIINFSYHILVLFSDQDLAEVMLGPDLGGPQGSHWRAMIADPGERVFVWHKTSTDN